MRLLLVGALVTVAATAHAKGWRHTPPEGYTASPSATFVQYMKQTGGQYCLLALYNPRPRTTHDAGELAEEWRGVVLKTFAPGTDATLPAKTTARKLAYLTRTAELVDRAGGRSYGELYMVSTRAAIGSLLAVSGTAATLEACRPAIAALLDSLEEPEYNQPSLMRTWGAATTTGRFVYTIATDGTYRFRSERQVAPDRWILVDETGTWSIEPGRLTLAPTAATAIDRSRAKITSTRPAPLEKATYAYEQQYFEQGHEWRLVLRTPKPTARDGAFTGKASYVYSDRAKIEWQRF